MPEKMSESMSMERSHPIRTVTPPPHQASSREKENRKGGSLSKTDASLRGSGGEVPEAQSTRTPGSAYLGQRCVGGDLATPTLSLGRYLG